MKMRVFRGNYVYSMESCGFYYKNIYDDFVAIKEVFINVSTNKFCVEMHNDCIWIMKYFTKNGYCILSYHHMMHNQLESIIRLFADFYSHYLRVKMIKN